MKKSRIVLAVVLCFVLVFAVAACDSGTADTATEAAGTESETASPTASEIESAVESAEESGAISTVGTTMSQLETPPETPVDPAELKVAIALGWTENDSGQNQQKGYEESLAAIGVTDITVVDAKYDVAVQAEQIESLIQTDPDVLFITPANATGLSEAVHHALDEGIAVFLSDGTVYGAQEDVTGQVVCDNYSNGYATMEYLAEALNYEGTIGLIKLDPQPAWKPRSDAALDVIAKYPDMEVGPEWSWDSTGVNTPRMAVDNFLQQYPEAGSLAGVWCAWDTAAQQGIQACEAADRTEILFVGHDGDGAVAEQILTSDQFVDTVGPCIYLQAYTNVQNAIDYLNGEAIPQFQYATSVQLNKGDLEPIKLEGDEVLGDYGKPGYVEKWNLEVVPHVDDPNPDD